MDITLTKDEFTWYSLLNSIEILIREYSDYYDCYQEVAVFTFEDGSILIDKSDFSTLIFDDDEWDCWCFKTSLVVATTFVELDSLRETIKRLNTFIEYINVYFRTIQDIEL